MNAIDAAKWIRFAEDDLVSAKKLIAPPNPQWGTGAYHCQQAAEKALKALLVLHEGRLQKKMETHDIGLLLEKLAKYIGDADDDLELKAEKLSQFSTIYRYPGLAPRPLTKDVVNKAITDAEVFLVKAKQLIAATENNGDDGGANSPPKNRGIGAPK